MKPLFLALLLIACSLGSIHAQKKLSTSRTSSLYTYIYRLTDKEAFEMAADPDMSIGQELMHSMVDSFKHDLTIDYPKKLPYGNYLYVKVAENQLSYKLRAVQNVKINFIYDGNEFRFTLTDLNGNLIEQANVLQGGSEKLRFDPVSRSYIGRLNAKVQLLSVLHEGVYNCFTYYYAKPPGRKEKESDYKPKDDDLTAQYVGQMIFNKPKYKPLDTVKFKAYLLTRKGRALKNIPVRVELSYYDEKGIVIANIKPYRQGGYEGSFVLDDTMKLKLDRRYTVSLKIWHKNQWATVFSGTINYEDYELNSTSFMVRSDKTVQYPGMPATFYLKATDENGLAVPDGRVSIEVTTNYVRKRYDNVNFVKSVLWKHNLNLDPVGETKLVLPDSIFPKVNMSITVDFTFRNSNNEVRKVQRSLNYNYENIELLSNLGADSVYFSLLRNGLPVQMGARLYTFGRNYEKIDSALVTFPVGLKINQNASIYLAKMSDGSEYTSNYSQLSPDFKLKADHSKDSLKLSVGSTQRIPFWYTLFANDKAIKRGYVSKLDTAMSFKEDDIAEISLNYLWQGRMDHQQRRAFYEKQELNIQMQAPEAVYPGQTVRLVVKVTDVESKPVVNTDLTAYAFTEKFRTDDDLYPLTIGDPYRFRSDKSLPSNPIPLEKLGNVPLEWHKWSQKFGLDSIVYYQFSYPNELYVGEEGIKNDEAVVVPFAISNGEVDPAYIVSIDGQPVYCINADQLKHYAFRVTPGVHKIELISFTHVISISYDFKKGFKTVLGIASDLNNTKARVRRIGMIEFIRRQQELQKHLLFVSDNFEGNKTLITGGPEDLLLNPPPNTYTRKILSVGPLTEKNLVFKSGELSMPFKWQPGVVYTFLKDGIKTRALDSAYNWIPYANTSPEARRYDQEPIARDEIDSIWNNFLDYQSRGSRGYNNSKPTGNHIGQLQLEQDTSIIYSRSYLKNIIIYKKDDPAFRQIYGEAELSEAKELNEGVYRLMFLFKDNQYFIVDNYALKSGGINYLKLKRKPFHPPDEMSITLDKAIKQEKMTKPGINSYAYEMPGSQVFPALFEKNTLVNRMSGVVTDAGSLETLPNATIYYQKTAKDILRPIRNTNINGFFDLLLPKKGILTFVFTGYDSKKINVKNIANLNIIMSETRQGLQDVVIRGYVKPGQRRTPNVPVANIEQLLQGRVAGLNIANNTGAPGLRGAVNIRGLSTITSTGSSGSGSASKPLYIVDGRPFSGDLDDIDQTAIISIEILTDKKAQALYGELGKNGVVLIKTNGTQHFGAGDETSAQQQTMRTHFSDAAFWQPKLLTDKNGSATFKVTFPDDITNWNTRVYAVNDRKQSGYFKTFIRSFKSLSANFVAPQFALNGDQVNVIGKLMNYNDREEKVVRSFVYNDKELLTGKLSFKNAHIDTMAITAPQTGDSLKFQYTLKQDSGYFDGEVRKIPLLSVGITETKGYFNSLVSDTSITYDFDPALGKVTLHAEASVFPVLLNEIDKLRRYEYLCNEQVASKLKALLLEQKLRKFLAEDFNGKKDIKQLIKRLQDSKTTLGTWGWWQDSDTELWISGHVVEALVMAKQAGFEVELNTAGLIGYLKGQLNDRKNKDQLFAARLMRTIDTKYDLRDWIKSADQQLKAEKEPSLYSRLQMIRFKQEAGMTIDLQWLMAQKKSTLFGNTYWGEMNSNFWDNSIQNTLLAYGILKAKGGYESTLQSMVRYFLEQRKDGQWRNTYESALILETILPDLMVDGKKPATPVLTLNKTETVSSFPFTKVIYPVKFGIEKKGEGPVYFTAYQQIHNANPEKAGKDFTVQTSFEQNGNSVTTLKGGVSAKLKVAVEVRADADYVMIEIPIPAGCSYENKSQNYWGPETHREYFKHKTSIFCAKLKQGKYVFDVQLMPRYSGIYHLNPAKAELMYFPAFSGREGMKKITVN